jgi:hypothetical protein
VYLYGLAQKVPRSSGATGARSSTRQARRARAACTQPVVPVLLTPRPCSVASFEANSEPHTGARPSVHLCVGPKLARCVHN